MRDKVALVITLDPHSGDGTHVVQHGMITLDPHSGDGTHVVQHTSVLACQAIAVEHKTSLFDHNVAGAHGHTAGWNELHLWPYNRKPPQNIELGSRPTSLGMEASCVELMLGLGG
eukprot:2737383-Amphidinium_carterae.1